jgi:hypothetical protein
MLNSDAGAFNKLDPETPSVRGVAETFHLLKRLRIRLNMVEHLRALAHPEFVRIQRRKIREDSMNSASAVTFESAERDYNDAWNAPSSTRYELPPVEVNKVLKEKYRLSPERTLTRAMIWDMETKKAWDPRTYIPYVVSQARSWGRMTLGDGSGRFSRSSMQRGWITPEEGRVLEDVFVSDAKQTIYFLGRPRMVEETGNTLVASSFQPLFHVRHAVGGSEQAPLNLWSIVLLTNVPDLRYCEPFEQMAHAGLLPGFLEIYIERDLKLKLSRI